MFRVRFHGRGGQGIKTASRILGTAFFLAGYEVQDAPRYGAERRGAPMFGYVRADHSPILERGVINRPDLIVVVDETLLNLPAAAVFDGLISRTILLILTDKSVVELQQKLPAQMPLLILERNIIAHLQTPFPMDSCSCSSAAAYLANIPLEIFQKAMIQELHIDDPHRYAEEFSVVENIYQRLAADSVSMSETDVLQEKLDKDCHWIDLRFEDARLSAPAIHGAATSLHLKTGDWRTMRPVIDKAVCNRCSLCHTFCPDGVIALDDKQYPHIDYDHCKGCLICLVQCPCKAISVVAEHDKEVGDA